MIKADAGIHTLAEKFVLLAVLLFPVTVVLIQQAGPIIFALTSLLALFVFFSKALKQTFSRDEKLLFYSCLLIFLMAMFTAWLGGFDNNAWKKMDGFLNLLLTVPLYFLFKTYLQKDALIWIGLALAVILCGAVAIYEMNFGALYDGFGGRAKAATHPILFADITLSMTFMFLLAASAGIFERSGSKLNWLAVLVLVMGMTAVILSGSRGAWVVVPVLLLMLIWQYRQRFTVRSWLISGGAVLIISIAAYLIPATGIQQRIDSTFSNVQKYSEGTNKGTSIGTRFEMWRASLMIFQQQPFSGVGWGNYKESAKNLVDEGKVDKSAMAWNHPHNEFLSALANGGLLMLSALLIFLFVPMSLFKKLLKTDDAKVRAYALAGISLGVGYAGYGLSEAIFERSIPTGFYAFYLALFFALANNRKEQKNEIKVQRKQKLSVTVIAYNEADRIENCLESVAGWADEIILFDNGSTDGTIELAKKYTDKVFVTDWPGYGKQKQRALEQAQYEWVLSIDADEQVTPELRAEIDRVLSTDSKEIAYRIPWAVTIYNKRLDFGRSGRAPLRLFKRAGAKFSEATVHERIILPSGNVGMLQERLLHFTHRDLKHSMDKFNKYAWLWATERFNRGKKTSMLSALIHGIWMFLVVFFARLGFLDGSRGLLMAVHFGLYTFNKYAALWTLGLQDKK